MTRFFLTSLLLLALPLAGCAGDSSAKSEAPQAETTKTESGEAAKESAPKTEVKVYDVACGCTIEAVGHCGEYAMVDGRHVEIKDHGLGSMPFCGKSGQKAKIAGEIEGDALHATSIEVVK